jgi:hypothetical protein
MKKTLVWFGTAFLAVGIAACGGRSKTEDTTPMQPTVETGAEGGLMEGTAPDEGSMGNPCGTEGSAPAGNPCSTPTPE